MTTPCPPGLPRAAVGLLLALAGCLPTGLAAPPGGAAAGNDTAARCQQSIAEHERTRCGLDDPSQQRFSTLEWMQMGLGRFRQQCTDPASRQRLDALEGTCTALFVDRERGRHADRRAVRERYLAQVSALLADPDYGPLVDREKDLDSTRRRGPGDDARLAETRQRLADLARKHGIDPGVHRELDLW